MQRSAFEFIEKVDRLSSADAVMAEFATVLRRHHGIEHYQCSFIALRTETLADVIMASRFPAGFFDAYNELDLVHHDPAYRHALRTGHPFRWFKEAPYDPETQPRAQEAVDLCRAFGLVDGIVIPVSTTARRLGLVWLGGPKLDVPTREDPALHLMAHYAFDRALDVQPAPGINLSERECEVLTLTAVGKKADQIADALNLSTSMVHKYLDKARCKLGAVTLPEAVATALHMRMLRY